MIVAPAWPQPPHRWARLLFFEKREFSQGEREPDKRQQKPVLFSTFQTCEVMRWFIGAGAPLIPAGWVKASLVKRSSICLAMTCVVAAGVVFLLCWQQMEKASNYSSRPSFGQPCVTQRWQVTNTLALYQSTLFRYLCWSIYFFFFLMTFYFYTIHSFAHKYLYFPHLGLEKHARYCRV